MLYENQAMINVFRDSGFEVHQAALGGSSLHVEFPVGGPESLRERVELRERIATANSIAPLLRPRAVAVIGASRDPAAVGSMIFRAILRSNFGGTVYPVNNQTTSVHGVRAYPSSRDLPEPPELAVIAVPARNVLEAAAEALQAGARGLLVVTSGFAESGPEGAALQKELVELVRSHGARLIGPNCLGLMNTHPDVRLNASLAPLLAPRGRIGFYSHSAALGLVILDYAAERGLGFSTFVSAGNRADVSGNDLLQFWEEDASTDIALLYLETFGNPRRFARIARRIGYRKPVLCVKGARSRAGGDVARAHIAAVAQSDTNVEMLFRQAGVIRADTLEEMFDVAVLLAQQPLPRGNRVGIISNSGGVLTICADACDTHGLSVGAGAAIDLGPLVPVDAYERAVQQTLERDDVDALIAIHACIGDCHPKVVGRAIRRGVLRAERRSGLSKPTLLCLIGGAADVQAHRDEDARAAASRRVFPSYRFPESAALALSRAVQYAAFRRRPAGRLRWYEDVDAAAARQEVTGMLDCRLAPKCCSWKASPPAGSWASSESVPRRLRRRLPSCGRTPPSRGQLRSELRAAASRSPARKPPGGPHHSADGQRHPGNRRGRGDAEGLRDRGAARSRVPADRGAAVVERHGGGPRLRRGSVRERGHARCGRPHRVLRAGPFAGSRRCGATGREDGLTRPRAGRRAKSGQPGDFASSRRPPAVQSKR